MLMDQCHSYLVFLVEGLEKFQSSKNGLGILKVYYAKGYFEGEHHCIFYHVIFVFII